MFVLVVCVGVVSALLLSQRLFTFRERILMHFYANYYMENYSTLKVIFATISPASPCHPAFWGKYESGCMSTVQEMEVIANYQLIISTLASCSKE